ncbi:MAG: DNA repair protein RecO, partial [Nitrospinota bacterium]
MPLYRTPAIILRNRKIGDADRMITFFSPTQGRGTAVARGAGKPRSRFGGSLQPLTLVQLIYFARETSSLGRISAADITHSFQSLRDDWEKTKAALYLVELVEKFTAEGEQNPSLFSLFLQMLYRLEATENGKCDPLLRIFEIRLLATVGYGLLLDRCASCGQGGDTRKHQAFSPSQGGWLCRTCRGKVPDARPMTAGTLRFLQKATSLDLHKIDRL